MGVRRPFRLVTILLTTILGGYLAVVLLVWWQQERLVFPGAGRGARDVDAPGARIERLSGYGGKSFRVVELGVERPAGVLLWFVGNGEDLRSAAWRAKELSGHGVTVIAPEYPGYGDSEGEPGVAAFLANAEIVGRYARDRAAASGVPLRLGGSSIGSFSAVHLAAQGYGDRLVLRAPPTTMADAAAARFGWLPVRALLRHPFDNVGKAHEVRVPTLVVHGDADTVVPLDLGRRLAAALAGPTAVVVVRAAGHNDLALGALSGVAERVGPFVRGEPLPGDFGR